jgi:hypothetical protein
MNKTEFWQWFWMFVVIVSNNVDHSDHHRQDDQISQHTVSTTIAEHYVSAIRLIKLGMFPKKKLG